MLLNSGRSGKRSTDDSGILSINERLNQKSYPAPRVTSFAFVDNAYVPYDDTALDPAGGQRVVLYGSGFVSGATVLVGGATIAVVTLIDSGRLTFISPANSSGSYTVYVTNPNGGTGILVPGLVYSGVPSFTTAAGSVGSFYETSSISANIVASGDSPITYTLDSGTLPTGATLFGNGTIAGTAPVDSSSTTYSFTVKATDPQLQDSTRSFTITINTDVVTWSSPGDGTTYNYVSGATISNVSLSASSAAGKTVSYSANSLPTGISLSGNIISGTPTVVASSSTLLTATATTTNKSATRTINWVISLASDTSWGTTSLLLSSNSSIQINSFVNDASTNNALITVTGDTRAQNFSPYTPGYYSLYFSGSDYLTTPSGDYTMTGDFTIEAWVNADTPATGGPYAICGQKSGVAWFDFRYYLNQWQISFNAGSGTSMGGTGSLSAGVWAHVAAVRSGSSVKVYVNGLSTATTITNSSTLGYSATSFYIGSSNGNIFKGYISNFRVVNGTALYTSNFTPTTSTLTSIANTRMLMAQSNRLIDNGPNAYAITKTGNVAVAAAHPFAANSSYATYGSGYFDGTGDYLTGPSNPGYNLSADFTIEAWVYPTSLSGAKQIFSTRATATTSTSTAWSFACNGTALAWYTTAYNISSGTLIASVWNHVSAVRSGSTLTLYINGVSIGTATLATDFTAQVLYIGACGNAAEPFTGYISDARVVKGTALYTTTFTPPATPLSAIANTSLLTLQNNGAHNNSTFSDNASYNNLITRAGNTTNGTFSPYGVNWSNYFDGTGDYLTTPATTNLSLTGDFTVECWVYVTASGYNTIVTTGTGGSSTYWMVYIDPNMTVGMGTNPAGNWNWPNLYVTTYTLSMNAWYHLAWVRNGAGVFNIYVNGVSQYSTSSFSNPASIGGTFYLGTYYNNYNNDGSFFRGYISNFRIIKGTALYTSTFSVPTSSLTSIANTQLLTCQNNRFVDNSPNNYTLTRAGDTAVQRFSPFSTVTVPAYYSTYFDGTGDYLLVADNAALQMASGDFTIEFWIYFNSIASYQTSFDKGYTGSGGLLVQTGNGNGRFIVYASGSAVITESGTGSVNTWIHYALVRSGSTLTLYRNGTSSGSASNSTNFNSTAQVGIAATGTAPAGGAVGDYAVNGYLSNLRIVKGTAVYTGAFTPPTSPLTAIANTSLLTCQSNTFIDNSPNYFTITANGNSKPLAVSPFTPVASSSTSYSPATFGGSMYFDGTGDYLTLNSANLSDFGTADFTMECWFYAAAVAATYQGLFDSRPDATDGAYVTFLLNTNTVCLYTQSAVRLSGTITAGTWVHAAIVRSSGTSKLYVNGVQAGASYADTNSYISRPAPIIGYLNGSANPFTGYISDFRITKGKALYTANFFPGTAPITNTTSIGANIYSSVLLLNGAAGGVIDATRTVNLETVGDAKSTTVKSPYASGGISYYLDGTGDSLAIPINNQLALGSGDFTVEFWFYNAAASIPTTTGLFDMRNGTNGIAVVQPTIDLWSANGYVWYTRAVMQIQSGSGVPALGVWQHIAVSRSSGSTKMFVNGTQVGSTYTDTNTYPAGSITIGRANDGVNTRYATGYITDLRITKGSARYTTAFTPPTTPLLTS